MRWIGVIFANIFWPSLFISDNFDNPGEIPYFRKTYVPVNCKGSTLITSRDKSVGALINPAEGQKFGIEGLDRGSAVELLLSRTNLSRSIYNLEQCKTIIDRLESHPLAIIQAAAYIKSRELYLAEFVHHHTKQKEAILRLTPNLTEYTKQLDSSEETALSAYTTWNLSFD